MTCPARANQPAVSPDEQRFRESLDRAYATACDALLAERNADGFWLGELSSSALATATAVSAMSLVHASRDLISSNESGGAREDTRLVPLISTGLRWLAEHQNADGGWGDTPDSFSNISTTMLVRAAFHLAGAAASHAAALDRATAYIDRQGGVAAVAARYGKDRTFAVPILANCALAGQADWRDVAPLPFELAALPHGFFRFLRLHVVSYALPALIAIGQLIHAKRPTWNVFARLIRRLAIAPTLRKLEAIQPESGGYLEAIPLTGFVVMSLVAAGRARHPVVLKGIDFIRNTARPDGSWPIDSNLSVWLTTLSINALSSAPDGLEKLGSDEQRKTRDWLLCQQVRTIHEYTRAAAGGWGWSHMSGSVPDADDTSGAILALANLNSATESTNSDPYDRGGVDSTRDAVQWLLALQNSDGGWPTFCRGWGRLPFDRSAPDLTAHALRAIRSYRQLMHAAVSGGFGGWVRPNDPEALAPESLIDRSYARGLGFLERVQAPDGYWVPLWFGNQHSAADENPTYGTARVLAAFRDADRLESHAARRAVDWLLRAQAPDGGWGGSPGTPPSVEESAVAVESLADAGKGRPAQDATHRGVQWLIDRVESGDWRKPSPIGLYFAKLWYSEKLYPLIFTVAALGRARRVLTH
jgi:squalene-hopene/tetraprenyl-beta-curcumene cyclase